ncbi:MAG: hypothetical protein ACOC5J_03400, partial [Gemmatimonadota bacterium]
TEEVGELAEAALEDKFGGSQSSEKGFNPRREAVQVAAVGLAIVEAIDANGIARLSDPDEPTEAA